MDTKISLEKVIFPQVKSSFSWLVNPKLNDFFFWHFHPEVELVFIEAKEGTRHVGEHFSKFKESDMLLIGSNIPHLNFDFGIKGQYQKTVLHFSSDFISLAQVPAPELEAIKMMIERSKYGIMFGDDIKKEVGRTFKQIHHLPIFHQFTEILSLLHTLSNSNDYQLLHEREPKNVYNKKEEERLKKIFKLIETQYIRKIRLDEAATTCHLSNASFCRYFKKMTRLSFTEFLNNYRINQAKRLLINYHNVTETCYKVGFESLTYFNRTFKRVTGENPSTFQKKYQNR